jgi:hypothetical protein
MFFADVMIFQWSCNSRCNANLHAFSYIEVIKVTPLIAIIVWFNNKKTYLYIHGNHFNHLKAKPLALCTIQIITTIPIIEMYIFYCIYVHFQPKCKYTTTKSRHFQLMKSYLELKSNNSTEINEGQAKV